LQAGPQLAEQSQTRKPAYVKRGDILEVDVSGLTLEGQGLAHLEERTVAISGAFPGEQAKIRITEVSKQQPRAYATTQTILRPHAARRRVPCGSHVDHGGACTGCALMPLEVDAQRELKRQLLQDQFGISVSKVEGSDAALGYRYSAKRVVFGSKGKIRLGSYARSSHRPAPMWDCLVDHPRLREAFAALTEQASALAIAAYDETTGTGDLRYAWAKTDGTLAILTLVTTLADSRAAKDLPDRLPGLAGILHSVQGARTNNMRGDEPRLLRGVSELEVPMLSEQIGAGALGFLQPNPEVAAMAYQALIEAPAGELAFDLYAGVGLTTRLLRRVHREVVACEAYAESARALGIEPERAEDFLARQNAQTMRPAPGLVVANPPRQGLGERVCQELLTLAPERIHLMSCGPEGFARDLARLMARYTLVETRAFDTLPQTPHVELVAKLQRKA